MFRKSWDCRVTLEGKTALITGGNTGIGKETARDFYRRGARVVIACRDMKKAETAIDEIKKESREIDYKNEIVLVHLDLSDLDTVRACARQILETEPQINLLINNAGIIGHPEKTNKDGQEIHFAVNHLGHFLFTMILLPKIIKSAPARIVTVSSLAHNFIFIGNTLDLDDIKHENKFSTHLRIYGQSKVANVLFSKELCCRLKDAGIDNVTTYSLHPGIIATELGRNFNLICFGFGWLWKKFSRFIFLTPQEGAKTTLYCALEEKLTQDSGLYYSNCQKANASSLVNNEALRKRLWDDSLKYVGLPVDLDPFTKK